MSGAYGPPSAPLAGGVTLVPGQIPYPDANGRLTGDSNWTYNSTTHRASIGALSVNSGTTDSIINLSAVDMSKSLLGALMASGSAYIAPGLRAVSLRYNYMVTSGISGGFDGGGSLIYGTVNVGDAGTAPIGSPGGMGVTLFVNNSGHKDNEYGPYFYELTALGADGLNIPFPSDTPGRFWGGDFSVQGPAGKRPGALGGPQSIVTNYYNGSPAGQNGAGANPLLGATWDPRSAAWNGTTGVTNNPSNALALGTGTGAGVSPTAPSYPLDTIIHVTGQTGTAPSHVGNRGATVAMMLGGTGTGWGKNSRFGTGVFARDYDYAAYEVGAPFPGSVATRSYSADAGAGPAVIGDGIQAGSAMIAAAHIATTPTTLTVSGNEITDATRAVNTQGDGRSSDSSFGIYSATTPLGANNGFETDTSGWTANSGTLTRTTATGAVIFGAASGQFVTSNLVANEGISETFSGAAATQYAISAWVIGPAGATLRIALFDSVSGKQASSPVTCTGIKQRLSVVGTTGAASSGFAVYVETDVKQSITFSVDGVQIEAKAYPTPYTVAARSAARVRATSAAFNTHQFWVAIRMRMGAAATALPAVTPFYWGDGGVSNFFAIFKGAAGNTTWTVGMKGGGVQTGQSQSVAMAAGDSVTFIGQFIYGVSAGISVNGLAFTTGSGVGAPLLSALPTLAEIGSLNSGVQVEGDVFWVAAGSGALANADAALIHGFGNTDPTLAHFAALNSNAANPTFFWSADTTAAKQGVVLTNTSGLVDLTQAIAQGQHGESAQIQYAEELITLATGAAFTDSTANLLPANSEILSVDTYVTTTITTAANWSVGDPTTAARFSSANSTLVATTSQVGLNHKDGAAAGAASAQKTAAKVRITCNANPGAGAVRVTVKYIQHAAPTS